jgi:uncharacterized lipoprotein YmbA
MRSAALRSFFLLVTGLMMVACAGSPDPLTHYLLRSDSDEHAGRVDAPRRISLGRVRVAPYLSQDGIVVQTAPGQIHAADLHRWAEPLQDGLRSLLRAQISTALGEDVHSDANDLRQNGRIVDVYIDRLHGTMTGTASIDATYRINSGDRSAESTEFRFSQATRLSRAGYPGLVDAEAELVGRLAAAIADSLREADE